MPFGDPLTREGSGRRSLEARVRALEAVNAVLVGPRPAAMRAAQVLSELARISGGFAYVERGGVLRLAEIQESDLADGAIFPRLAADETITGHWTIQRLTVSQPADAKALEIHYSSNAGATFDPFAIIDDDGNYETVYLDLASGFFKVPALGIHAGGKTLSIQAATLTADRTLTAPDRTGTIMLLSNSQTCTGIITFTGSNLYTGGGRHDVDGTSSKNHEADAASTTKRAARDCSGITAGQTRRKKYLDRDTTEVGKVYNADVNLTGQVADIATTNLLTSPGAGAYAVLVYLECTTAGAGLLTFTLGWTDDVGATTDATITLSMAGTGRARGWVPIYVASGHVTYAIGGYVSGAYALRLRPVALD